MERTSDRGNRFSSSPRTRTVSWSMKTWPLAMVPSSKATCMVPTERTSLMSLQSRVCRSNSLLSKSRLSSYMAMILPLSHSSEVVWIQSNFSGMGGGGCQLSWPSSATAGPHTTNNATSATAILSIWLSEFFRMSIITPPLRLATCFRRRYANGFSCRSDSVLTHAIPLRSRRLH